MFLRNLPGTTLGDLRHTFDTKTYTWGGSASSLSVRLLDEQPIFSLGSHEVPVTEAGRDALASFFDIPVPFLRKSDADIQQYLLSNVIERTGGDLTVVWNSDGIHEVRKPTQVRVAPHKLLDAALRVLPEESPIVEWWNDSRDLRVDVIVPEGFDRHVGGDPSVGDITRGGVRIGQDRKHNTAPWVQPYLYRLVCTNGMEVPDLGIRVDARQVSAEQIEALFEAEVRRAVDRLEQDIQAFYDLRSVPLGEDPTGALRRTALEQDLPNLTVGRLEDTLPSILAEESAPTLFDAVNLMTNAANDPSLGERSSTRRNLQRAGGRVVHDHVERCAACHSRLSV